MALTCLAGGPAFAFPVEDGITEQNTGLIYNETLKGNELTRDGNNYLSQILDAIGKAGPVATPSAYRLSSTMQQGLRGLFDQSYATDQWSLPQEFARPSRFGDVTTGYNFFAAALTSGFTPAGFTTPNTAGGSAIKKSFSTQDGALVVQRRQAQEQQAALVGLAAAGNSNTTLPDVMAQADTITTSARSAIMLQNREAILADALAAILVELAAQRMVMTQLLQLQAAAVLRQTPVSFGITMPGGAPAPTTSPKP